MLRVLYEYSKVIMEHPIYTTQKHTSSIFVANRWYLFDIINVSIFFVSIKLNLKLFDSTESDNWIYFRMGE